MKLRLTGFLCIVACMSFAQNRSIKFQESEFKALLSQAKKENKLIFIDAYTTWCGPCKWMAKNMFTNNEIADYYNANFINAKFDMEKGEGIELAQKYSVYCYPNLLFLDGDGNLVHRTAGAAQDVQTYIDLGETAKNPAKNFSSLMKQYETKYTDPAFMVKFVNAMAMTCMPYEKYVEQYFATQQESDLFSAQNWRMIQDHLKNYESREFKYFVGNADKYAELYDRDSVQSKIAAVYQEAGNQLIYANEFDEKGFKSFLEMIRNNPFAGSDAVMFHLEMTYQERINGLDAVFALLVQKGEQYLNEDEMNSYAWAIYENSDNRKYLEKAEEWMKKVTASEYGKDSWAYWDTYASVLFKLKKKALAKSTAEKAIKVAKETQVPSEDYQATVDLLAKINKL